jgi:hypothetical protein
MKDYMVIDSSPYEENCAQVGSDNYEKRAKQECSKFINLIVKKCGVPPIGAKLKTTSFPHDFGRYYEVIVEFDTAVEDSVEYALFVEANAPRTWNDNKMKRKFNDS